MIDFNIIKKNTESAYVYLHKTIDTNEAFYVGIGCSSNYKRAYQTTKRSEIWKRYVKKHGRNVEILDDKLTWHQAQEREKYWIKFYGRKDLNEGTLVNFTDGGEGALGWIASKEICEKIRNNKLNQSSLTKEMNRLSKLGNKNPMSNRCWINNGLINKVILKTESIEVGWKLGRICPPHTTETKKLISLKTKEGIINNGIDRKNVSIEVRRKIGESIKAFYAAKKDHGLGLKNK